MSLPNKFIVFLGRTFRGHHHDDSMLKQEFPPELDWLTDLHVHVDPGYLGIRSDSRGDQLDMPTKKPRKSQKNPNPPLSDAHKFEPSPPLHRAGDWRHEALQHIGVWLPQSQS
jgi:hypothetical protein